jgi:AraC-like DNA-binding protein
MEIFIGVDKPVRIKYDYGVCQGKIMIVPQDIYHEVGCIEDEKIIIMLDADSSLAKKILRKYVSGSHIANPDIGLDQTDMKYFVKNHNQENINVLFNLVINALLAGDCEPADMNERITSAISFMNNLQSKKIPCKKLAYEIGLSEGRLMHLFKEKVGITVRAFLLWLRLLDAVKNILSGQSLTYAAHFADFSDYAHFSRTFSAMFGLSLSDIFKNKNSVKIIESKSAGLFMN